MFVSDVFIHGVGGAKYDKITDGIIRDFYKVEPPDFITTSLTLYPSLEGQGARGKGQEEPLGIIKELERKLRDMRYNPERYITPPHSPPSKGGDKEGVHDILDEKKSLLSLLEKDNINRKDISIQLKEINDKLYQKIKPDANEIKEKINVLAKQQQEIEAIQRRDYPYFLFSPKEVMKIILSVFQ
jgi:hypothetical protein